MTLSSNTAQMRELSELRNHLKWLDEERRKAARKMSELEQKLAQQGRELSERDQRIQDLEWQIASLMERPERSPEADAEAAGQAQRLQDLEWHLSNINAQLVRLPRLDEEMARLREDVGRASVAFQDRFAEDQQRLTDEMADLRSMLPMLQRLIDRMAEREAADAHLEEQMLALRDSLPSVLDQGRLAETIQRFEDEEVRGRELTETLGRRLSELETQLTTIRSGLEQNLDHQSEVVRSLADRQSELEQSLSGRQSELEQSLTDRQSELQQRLEMVQMRIADQPAVQQAVEQQMALMLADLREQMDAELETQRSAADRAAAHLQEMEQRLADQPDVQQVVERQMAFMLTDLREQMDAELAAQRSAAERATAHLRQMEQRLQEAVDKVAQTEEQVMARSAERFESLEMRVSRELAQQQILLEQLATQDQSGVLTQLEQEMELRQAEEVRLANLIALQENRLSPLAEQLAELQQLTATMQGRAAGADRALEEMRAGLNDFEQNWKPVLMEAGRRLQPMNERLGQLNNSATKLEASVQSLTEEQSDVRETIAGLAEEVKRSQREVERQIEAWQMVADEQKDTIERFTQQWASLSNQYKEARMAVQNFAHWQKQLEQQRREAAEMLRVESNRMQSRWDAFLTEVDERLRNADLDLAQKWKAFEMDNEQRWSTVRRGEQQWREELAAVDELIVKLQQDNRNLIWRVQAAQADAIKKWPRLLLEEVEKAVELNPNRRLQAGPAAPRADLSVVDAIEQGLIRIDYEEDEGAEKP